MTLIRTVMILLKLLWTLIICVSEWDDNVIQNIISYLLFLDSLFRSPRTIYGIFSYNNQLLLFFNIFTSQK